MNPILYPLLSQILLTFLVWCWLLSHRVGTLVKRRIHPQVVADEAKAQEIYKDSVHISDNFENLFEMPVLFFTGAVTLLHLGIQDVPTQILAWGFVAFRGTHSLIHTTSNNIRYRFLSFFASSLFLWVLWARIAFHVIP